MPSPRVSHYKKGVPGLPKRARALCELMVEEGLGLKEAGVRMGIKPNTARTYFRLPSFNAYRLQCLAEIRNGEQGKNLRVAMTLRDEGAKKAASSHRKVAIEAMRFIENRDGPASVSVSVGVGVGVNLQPGYLVDATGYTNEQRERILKQARSTRAIADVGGDYTERVIEGDPVETAPPPQRAPAASVEPGFGPRPFEQFAPRDSRRRRDANEKTADALEAPGEYSGPA